jgi:hypothetical protein
MDVRGRGCTVLLREGAALVLIGLGLAACTGDLTELDLCAGELKTICDPPPGPTPPVWTWVMGSVYLGTDPLTGVEGAVEIFYDTTAPLAYHAVVDSASGLWGRQIQASSVCALTMFAKARYRTSPDSMWHESAYEQFAPVTTCPDTVRVETIVIAAP